MATGSVGRVASVLGGVSVLGRNIVSSDDLRRRVRDGLPYSALVAVEARLGLRPTEIESMLALPARTRMRRKKTKVLSAVQSDRLYRLARIASIAVDVLGDETKTTRWLRKPNRSLGHSEPLQLLDTEIGAREVEDALGRIEHGIFG
jgi:putative toxin-antitoxin system antitoxin component (TIGR02293 family)